GAHFKEGLCFFIEPLAFPAIEDRFPQDAERSLRPEIILVVKAVYGVENLVRWQPWILNVGKLRAALIHHFVISEHQAVFRGVLVEFGARVSRRVGCLHGVDVPSTRGVEWG